jgi:hypothetical protein
MGDFCGHNQAYNLTYRVTSGAQIVGACNIKALLLRAPLFVDRKQLSTMFKAR